MTGKKKSGDLGAVLGNLRRDRGADPAPAPEQARKQAATPAAAKVREPREAREAFTSRLKPSQRRWLKRWAADLEEETGGRVTVEYILEAFAAELQESEALQARLAARIAGED